MQKIIRSRLPLKFDSEGINYQIQYLSGNKYVNALIDKLSEELDELLKAEKDIEKTIEAGDVIQVVYAFANYYKFEIDDLVNRDSPTRKDYLADSSHIAKDLQQMARDFIKSVKHEELIQQKAEGLISKVIEFVEPINANKVEEGRLSKLKKNGDFNEGVFLEYMDLPEEHPHLQVFLQNPIKYRPSFE